MCGRPLYGSREISGSAEGQFGRSVRGGKATTGMGAAGAHLAYIERETAVETLQRLEERGRERELDAASPMEG